VTAFQDKMTKYQQSL